MKKLIIPLLAAVAATLSLSSCDEKPEGLNSDLIENIYPNQAGSPLNALWEAIYDEGEYYCDAIDFRNPGAMRFYVYNPLEYLSSSITLFRNMKEDDSFFNIMIPELPIPGFRCKDNPNFGGFIYASEDDPVYQAGWLYMVEDGNKLTLVDWDPTELPLDKVKEFLDDFAAGTLDKEKFVDGSEIESELDCPEGAYLYYRHVFRKVSELSAYDFTENRIAGYVYGAENFYNIEEPGLADVWPLSEAYRITNEDDYSFCLEYASLGGIKMNLYLKISESLLGKDLLIANPEEEGEWPYGGFLYIRFGFSPQMVFKQAWTISSNGENSFFQDAFYKGQDYYSNQPQPCERDLFLRVDYDKDTRHLEFNLNDGDYIEYGIHADTIVEKEMISVSI